MNSNCLNVCDFSDEWSAFKNVAFIQFNSVHVDRSEVQTLNLSVNIRKSPGPDGTRGRWQKKMCSTACRYFLFYFHRHSSTSRFLVFAMIQLLHLLQKAKLQNHAITTGYLSNNVFWKDCKECSCDHSPWNFRAVRVCLQARQRCWQAQFQKERKNKNFSMTCFYWLFVSF